MTVRNVYKQEDGNLEKRLNKNILQEKKKGGYQSWVDVSICEELWGPILTLRVTHGRG